MVCEIFVAQNVSGVNRLYIKDKVIINKISLIFYFFVSRVYFFILFYFILWLCCSFIWFQIQFSLFVFCFAIFFIMVYDCCPLHHSFFSIIFIFIHKFKYYTFKKTSAIHTIFVYMLCVSSTKTCDFLWSQTKKEIIDTNIFFIFCLKKTVSCKK